MFSFEVSDLKPEVLILGGTDLTVAIAEAVLETGVAIAAIVDVGPSFSISYAAGRVTNARHVPIVDWCAARKIEIVHFTSYDEVAGRFAKRELSLCLVAGWYHMVPRRFRGLFPLGCLGLHASLLPQLRGGAPLNWAILSGLTTTGVTLFELSDAVDDGLVYQQISFPVLPKTTIGELVRASRAASAQLVRTCIPEILAGRLHSRPQVGQPSYGLQRAPEDGEINWNQSAATIDRLIRAVGRPYPGAFTSIGENRVFIWAAETVENGPIVWGAPGQIAQIPGFEAPCVVTGEGLLLVLEATDQAGDDIRKTLGKSTHQRFSPPRTLGRNI